MSRREGWTVVVVAAVLIAIMARVIVWQYREDQAIKAEEATHAPVEQQP